MRTSCDVWHFHAENTHYNSIQHIVLLAIDTFIMYLDSRANRCPVAMSCLSRIALCICVGSLAVKVSVC
jgi:hypothetical protein